VCTGNVGARDRGWAGRSIGLGSGAAGGGAGRAPRAGRERRTRVRAGGTAKTEGGDFGDSLIWGGAGRRAGRVPAEEEGGVLTRRRARPRAGFLLRTAVFLRPTLLWLARASALMSSFCWDLVRCVFFGTIPASFIVLILSFSRC